MQVTIYIADWTIFDSFMLAAVALSHKNEMKGFFCPFNKFSSQLSNQQNHKWEQLSQVQVTVCTHVYIISQFNNFIEKIQLKSNTFYFKDLQVE